MKTFGFFSYQMAAAVAVGLLTATASGGQANSWLKTSSGYWEEPYWSLGLPNSSQTMEFTNAGWKALATVRTPQPTILHRCL